MQLARSLLFTTLLLSGCSKKDPLAELDGHITKVCAATDYKTARKAWTDTLGFLQNNEDAKELDETTRQVTTAIIDHGAIKQATGRALKLLTCAEKTGAL